MLSRAPVVDSSGAQGALVFVPQVHGIIGDGGDPQAGVRNEEGAILHCCCVPISRLRKGLAGGGMV